VRLAVDIGPSLWLKPNGVEQSIAKVRSAEAAGFDTVWASEDPDGWDAFGALAVLARETDQIHLGTGVTNPYLRHPNLISASVSTLDRSSNGRAFLGLGRGEPEWYRNAFAMELGSPLAHVEETVSLLRQWWGPDQTARGEGEIPVRDWRRAFPPLNAPPIYIAATGPKMQRLAGRVADGVRFNRLASVSFLKRAIATVKEGALSENRNPAALRIFAHPSLTITERDDQIEPVLEGMKTTIALIHALPGMDKQLEGLESEFDIAAILERVRRHMRTDEILARGGSFADLRLEGDLDAARKAIPTALVDRVALVGPVERVLPRLAQYAEIGITDVFANPDQIRDKEIIAQVRSL
jgi:5,10-methylenetetrahydromethanopterin reductase